MSEVKENLLYSEEHEWAHVLENRTVRVGITDFAQSQLGDIVFVEFPEEGTRVRVGDNIGTIESVKTVSDLFCPVSGTVTKVNDVLLDQPELVNEEPYAGGWMIEIELEENAEEDMKRLLSSDQYKSYIDQQN